MSKSMYRKIGTRELYIEDQEEPESIEVSKSYFLLKVINAQAAFFGSIWERANKLIVSSKIEIPHPAFTGSPYTNIHLSYDVKRQEARQLGLSIVLVELIPVIMDRIRVAVEFLLDKTNRLSDLKDLIDNKAFYNVVSLVPGAALAGKAISDIAEGVLTLLKPSGQTSILRFQLDFPFVDGTVKSGYYVILGTRDKEHPFPDTMPALDVKDNILLADGKEVEEWSYLILQAVAVPHRYAETGTGKWVKLLNEVKTVTTKMEFDFRATNEDRFRAYEQCEELIHNAHVLLLDDPLYLADEANQIIRDAYTAARHSLLPEETKGLGAPPILEHIPSYLGVPDMPTLEKLVEEYHSKDESTKKILKRHGLLE